MPTLLTPDEFTTRARRIRLACFDVDGTLTDGRLGFSTTGAEHKAFHVHDGQGLVLLPRAGLQVALVTARASTIVERRAQELGIQACTAVADKLACVQRMATAAGMTLDEVAFMGDDLPDLRVMQHVGLSACPADAHAWTQARVHWQATRGGGAGAAREFVDALLTAQGKVDALLAGVLGDAPVPTGQVS